jgi:hypothetical protein
VILEVRSFLNFTYTNYARLFTPTTPPLSTFKHEERNNTMATTTQNNDADALIKSHDPKHPANLICSLCRQFYTFGWVTGTGGGVSIKHDDHIFLAPSGVEKELMQPENIFVMDYASKEYIRRPLVG